MKFIMADIHDETWFALWRITIARSRVLTVPAVFERMLTLARDNSKKSMLVLFMVIELNMAAPSVAVSTSNTNERPFYCLVFIPLKKRMTLQMTMTNRVTKMIVNLLILLLKMLLRLSQRPCNSRGLHVFR